MLQGALANFSGQKLETVVSTLLTEKKFKFDTQFKFNNVYNRNAKIDFLVKYPKTIAIECKRQSVSGSVDEKIPFVIENLFKLNADLSLLVLDGDWYRKQRGLVIYSKNKAAGLSNKIKVVFIEELESVLDEFCKT